MARRAWLASLVLLGLSACEERARVRVAPAELLAFEGASTHVAVRAELGCREAADPVLEAADGVSPSPPPFAVEVDRVPTVDEYFFIGNPGTGRDVTLPSDPPPSGPEVVPLTFADDDPGRRAFDLLLAPAAGTAGTVHRLRVRVSGCGTEASAELTVRVLGALDLGGFCGITAGAGCAADGGCARAGCGEVCAGATQDSGAGGAGTEAVAYAGAHCYVAACRDPVPTGAICGCLLGACAWRLP